MFLSPANAALFARAVITNLTRDEKEGLERKGFWVEGLQVEGWREKNWNGRV
jgi:hypothetical protein